MAILEAKDLRKIYGSGENEVRALDGVLISIEDQTVLQRRYGTRCRRDRDWILRVKLSHFRAGILWSPLSREKVLRFRCVS